MLLRPFLPVSDRWVRDFRNWQHWLPLPQNSAGEGRMATTTGVSLPDEQEQQSPKKSSQCFNSDHIGLSKRSEQELKAAIISAWKKHEELAKQDLAPLLYWLREKLRAQGARNDLVHDKDRGWEVWVTEHLDISRRTADRWCAWYAEKEGLVLGDSTSGHVTGSDAPYEEILAQHRGKQQISFNYWVNTAVHAQYQKALTKIQNKAKGQEHLQQAGRGLASDETAWPTQASQYL